MRRYEFRPRNASVITPQLAARIVKEVSGPKKPSKVRITLDIGLTYTEAFIDNEYLWVGDLRLRINDLRRVCGGSAVYLVVNDSLEPIQFYDDSLRRFYKLRAVGESIPPTLEINGIHMHRIEGIDPWRDSYSKVKCLGRLRGGRVLDICTGLGYTAIAALRRGAAEVLSVEVDENVLRIAELNPWSKELSRASVLLGDAAEVIKELPSDYFTHVIHDPPRFSMAGHLYGYEFYREVYRVLVSGGRLYHYVGSPGRLRRVNLARGVAERLRSAGFIIIRWDEVSEGLIAIKP